MNENNTYTNEQLNRWVEEAARDFQRFQNRLQLTPRDMARMLQMNYDKMILELQLNNYAAPERWLPQIRGAVKALLKNRGYKLVKIGKQ